MSAAAGAVRRAFPPPGGAPLAAAVRHGEVPPRLDRRPPVFEPAVVARGSADRPLAPDPPERPGRGTARDGPIRILHAVGTMNRGGAESMLMDLLRLLDPARFSCAVLAHGATAGEFEPELERLGIPVLRHPSLGSLGYPRYVATLARFLGASGPFDVVHSHLDWQGAAIAAGARLARVPTIVVHSHAASWSRPDSPSERLHLASCRLLVRVLATDAWACSRDAGVFLFDDRTIASGRFRIVRNAIDTDRFFPVDSGDVAARRAALGLPRDALVLGHVGSLSPVKNQGFLLDLVSRLARRGESVRLLLVGDGPDRSRLIARARELGIEREVVFTGSRSDVPDLLAVLDVFVFPSISEGLGLAAVEAQAAGIPCVVSGAVPGEADMGIGLLARAAPDPDAWVDAIDRLRGSRRHDRSAIAKSIARRGYDARLAVAGVASLYEAAVARDGGA